MNRWIVITVAFSASCVLAAAAAAATTKQPPVKVAMRSTANERMTRYRTLLLEYFDVPRHPFINEENWLYARQGVINELERILFKVPNVTMEMQDFHTDILYKPNEPTTVEGKNIIVTFNGRNRGTSNDEILLVGAHYDSDNTGPLSLNDNGSGVVAMLEVVRGLADAIVNKRAVLLNTVIFVAFDVQRFEHELVGELDQGAGSMYYVNHKLSAVLNTEPKPSFLGAIILDAVMNYNTSENSQVLPNGFDKSFPEAYQTIKENKNTGNYLNMVTKEKLRSLRLDYMFAQQWREADPNERYPLTALEIRREAASPALFEFIRQDHIAFWNYVSNGSANPLPAILITDTGKWRGMQLICGLNPCNGTNFITQDRLNQLDQVVLAIDRFISNSHLDGVKIDTGNSGDSVFASTSASILLLAVSFLFQ